MIRLGIFCCIWIDFKITQILTKLQTPCINIGLKSFEDILEVFYKKFDHLRPDFTTINDFVEGFEYSAHKILTLAQSYDTRSGGILPIGSVQKTGSIVIKATLKGGKYPNRWNEKSGVLEYYLKDRNGIAKETYVENQAITNSMPDTIYTFLRKTPHDSFTYLGQFSYETINIDNERGKFFKLKRSPEILYEEHKVLDGLEAAIDIASKSSVKERRLRLAKAEKKPNVIYTTNKTFVRNPDVIIEVLTRANGYCEICRKLAPFKKRNGAWYLEVHHKKQLSKGGNDTVEDAQALCPNCHREQHFG